MKDASELRGAGSSADRGGMTEGPDLFSGRLDSRSSRVMEAAPAAPLRGVMAASLLADSPEERAGVPGEEFGGEGRPAEEKRKALNPLVLIADDQPGIRDILSVVLSPAYRIVEACDGEVGMAKAAELMPDVAIIDVVMPKMNGVEMARALRQHPELSGIPIISMSGYEELASKSQLSGLGVCAHLTKPFSILEVPALVEHALNSRQPRARGKDSDLEDLAQAAPRAKAPSFSEDGSEDERWLAAVLALLSQFPAGEEIPGEIRASVGQMLKETSPEHLKAMIEKVSAFAARNENGEQRENLARVIKVLHDLGL